MFNIYYVYSSICFLEDNYVLVFLAKVISDFCFLSEVWTVTIINIRSIFIFLVCKGSMNESDHSSLAPSRSESKHFSALHISKGH